MNDTVPKTKVVGLPNPSVIDKVPSIVVEGVTIGADGTPQGTGKSDELAVTQRKAIWTGRKRAAGEKEQ